MKVGKLFGAAAGTVGYIAGVVLAVAFLAFFLYKAKAAKSTLAK